MKNTADDETVDKTLPVDHCNEEYLRLGCFAIWASTDEYYNVTIVLI